MTASDIPEPSAPPPPTYIRPNAHIRPLHLPHLDHYNSQSFDEPGRLDEAEPSAAQRPPSPPPNHYQHPAYTPTPPPPPPPPPSAYYQHHNEEHLTSPHHAHQYSADPPGTTPSSPSKPRPQQPAQTPLPKPAVAQDQQDSHPFCYIVLGALLALFFNVFALLFLCCPSGMGIHGRRRPSYVAGVGIGSLVNAAGIACLYYFVVKPLVD